MPKFSSVNIDRINDVDHTVYIHPDGVSSHSPLIQSAISEAVHNGSNHLVLQGGDFTISESIKIPSNFHLELDNANVTLGDGANCNIIISANADDLSDAENITISGTNSILDGNYEHQSIDSNSYKRIGVLLFNVKSFDISGIEIKNTHGWAMSFESGCQNGQIHDIVINQDGGSINQDGIDIRGGCHDIEIYNIRGCTDDDCIACTAMLGNVMQVLNNGANGKDIYNIDIHDINMESSYCNVIDLICHDTCKTHDIFIHDIFDCSADGKTFSSSGSYSHTIMIGNYDFTNYAISGTPGTVDDMYNICINNIVSNSHMGIGIGWACKDVNISNVKYLNNPIYGIILNDGMTLPFLTKRLSISNADINGNNTFIYMRNQRAKLEDCLFKEITIRNCDIVLWDFGDNGQEYSKSAFLKFNLYGGNRLIKLNTDSAPYLDMFWIPEKNSFTTLYPSDGSAKIGALMPFQN